MGDTTMEDIKKGTDLPQRPNNTPSSNGTHTETRSDDGIYKGRLTFNDYKKN